MNNHKPYIGFLPLSGIFLAISAVLYFASRTDPDLLPFSTLLIGNGLFCILMMFSLFLMTRSGDSHMGFFRGFYLSTLVRLILTTGIILGLYKLGNLPKPSLFVLLGNYFIYMIAEVTLINQWIQKNT